MGMVVVLTTLSDENIGRILSDPPLVWKVVAPDEPDLYEQAAAETSRPSLLARLTGKKAAVSPAAAFTLGPAEGVTTDLDKSWHGIHYLLTGTAKGTELPEGFLLSGGRMVGDIEVGYGPARAFSVAETGAIAAALDAMPDDQLRARFDPAEMMRLQIYPEIWDRYPASPEPLDYVFEHVAALRGFLRQAFEARMGLVVAVM